LSSVWGLPFVSSFSCNGPATAKLYYHHQQQPQPQPQHSRRYLNDEKKVTMVTSASSSSFDEPPPSLTAVTVLNTTQLRQYIQETIDETLLLKTVQLDLQCENYRRLQSRVRCVLRLPKVQYKQQYRDFLLEEKWKLVDEFVNNDVQTNIIHLVDKDDAPFFVSTLNEYYGDDDKTNDNKNKKDPIKFFSSLVRGRKYQGQFHRLLKDLTLHDVLGKYDQIMNNDATSMNVLLQSFVEYQIKQLQNDQPKDNNDDDDDDDTIVNAMLLQRCMSFLKNETTGRMATLSSSSSPTNDDFDRQWIGQQTESDLTSYLKKKKYSEIDDGTTQILSPVLIQPTTRKNGKQQQRRQRRQRLKSNKHRYAIEVPSDHPTVIISSGFTNEFDAMVVSFDGNTIEIDEVWDAKATLDIKSIYNVLKKKVSSIQSILNYDINDDVQFVLYDDDDDNDGVNSKVYKIRRQPENFPKIGIFGSRLVPPKDAAKKFQLSICERHLEQDLQFVQTILTTTTATDCGYNATNAVVLPAFVDEQVRYLQQMIQIIETIKPTIVVA
jgi:hypothetical protein